MQIRRIVLGDFATNCYIVSAASGRCVVIDPADDGDGLIRRMTEEKLEPEAILLTHGHYDHFLAVPRLQKQWTSLPVYCHPLDCPEELTEYDMGRKYPTVTAFSNLRPLEDNQKLNLCGLSFTVLHTPGHTPGSVSFIAENVLFSGDTLFRGSIGRTDFAGGNDRQMRSSLIRLASLEGDYRVLPGHEGETTLERERHSNFYMKGI